MRAPRHSPSPRARAGFTFAELAVVMLILLVALLIFSSTMSGMSKQRAINRESAIAMEAARSRLESMRGVEFDQVFARFNADPDDDPEGPGTAPGNRFAVASLVAAPDSPDGLQGEVVFPVEVDPIEGPMLRENLDLPALGMPRDLSGDSIIDELDHAGDYFILPALVRIRWTGKSGLRQYEIATQLCLYNKE